MSSGRRQLPRTGRTRARGFLGAAALVVGLAVAAGVWWPRARVRGVRREAGLSVLLDHRRHAPGRRPRCLRKPLGAHPVDWTASRKAVPASRTRTRHNVPTLPSHANILSGRYPVDHGVRDNSGFRFPRGTETLATLLAARGYRTGAFVSAFPLDSRFGLDRGFEVYDDASSGRAAAGVPRAGAPGRRHGRARPALARDAAGPAVLLLGARVRAALPLPAARALCHALPRRPVPRRGGRRRRRARAPPRTDPGRGRAGRAARGPDLGPRRVPGRARRG